MGSCCGKMATMRFKDKIALVTGGARGIGKAIAKRLVVEGASVWISDIDEEALKETSKELNCKYVVMNVADEKQVVQGIKRIVEDEGKIDLLVNNAGITDDTLLIRMKLEQWKRVIDVNLTGTFLVTREVAKVMIKNRYGRIVNIASVVGEMGNPGQANYAASKAGMIAFTKTIAKELAARNITANAIAPGFVETKMTEALPEKVRQAYFEAIPLQRFAKPEEIAGLVAFLLSEEASYITGEVIRINGGLYI